MLEFDGTQDAEITMNDVSDAEGLVEISRKEIPETIPVSETTVAALLRIPGDDLVLINPALGKGAHGACSLWRSLNTGKLHVRKLLASKQRPWETIHTFKHELVPELTFCRAEGQNPNFIKAPSQAEAPKGVLSKAIEVSEAKKKALHFWTALIDYVPGPSLLSVEMDAHSSRQQIPEFLVWQCATDLLTVIKALRFDPKTNENLGRKAINHNDIYSRNIMCENGLVPDADPPRRFYRFHLLDFGIATTFGAKQRQHDLWDLCVLLFEMGTAHQQGSRTERRAQWSHSRFLLNIIEEMMGTVRDCEVFDCPQPETFDAWIRDCRAQAEKTFRYTSGPEEPQVSNPVVRNSPFSENGENKEAKLSSRLEKCKGDHGPWQMVYLDKDDWTIHKIDETIHWKKVGLDQWTPMCAVDPETGDMEDPFAQ